MPRNGATIAGPIPCDGAQASRGEVLPSQGREGTRPILARAGKRSGLHSTARPDDYLALKRFLTTNAREVPLFSRKPWI
jgi:hypothetical protein